MIKIKTFREGDAIDIKTLVTLGFQREACNPKAMDLFRGKGYKNFSKGIYKNHSNNITVLISTTKKQKKKIIGIIGATNIGYFRPIY